jgi:hypothetical protein
LSGQSNLFRRCGTSITFGLSNSRTTYLKNGCLHLALVSTSSSFPAKETHRTGKSLQCASRSISAPETPAEDPLSSVVSHGWRPPQRRMHTCTSSLSRNKIRVYMLVNTTLQQEIIIKPMHLRPIHRARAGAASVHCVSFRRKSFPLYWHQ